MVLKISDLFAKLLCNIGNNLKNRDLASVYLRSYCANRWHDFCYQASEQNISEKCIELVRRRANVIPCIWEMTCRSLRQF